MTLSSTIIFSNWHNNHLINTSPHCFSFFILCSVRQSAYKCNQCFVCNLEINAKTNHIRTSRKQMKWTKWKHWNVVFEAAIICVCVLHEKSIGVQWTVNESVSTWRIQKECHAPMDTKRKEENEEKKSSSAQQTHNKFPVEIASGAALMNISIRFRWVF